MTPQDDVDKRLQPEPIPGQRNAPPLPPLHLKPLLFVGPVSNTVRKTSILALTIFDYYIPRTSPASPAPWPRGLPGTGVRQRPKSPGSVWAFFAHSPILAPLRRLRTGAAFSSRSLLSNPVISGSVFCPFSEVGGTPPRAPPPLLSFLNNLPHRSLLTIKRDHVVESIRKTFGHETLPLGHKIISQFAVKICVRGP